MRGHSRILGTRLYEFLYLKAWMPIRWRYAKAVLDTLLLHMYTAYWDLRCCYDCYLQSAIKLPKSCQEAEESCPARNDAPCLHQLPDTSTSECRLSSSIPTSVSRAQLKGSMDATLELHATRDPTTPLLGHKIKVQRDTRICGMEFVRPHSLFWIIINACGRRPGFTAGGHVKSVRGPQL